MRQGSQLTPVLRYKTCNTSAQLSVLSDFKLKTAGVDDKEERKLVMAAIRKGGYISKATTKAAITDTEPVTSTSTAAQILVRPNVDNSRVKEYDLSRRLRLRNGNGNRRTMQTSFYLMGLPTKQLHTETWNSTRSSTKRLVSSSLNVKLL